MKKLSRNEMKNIMGGTDGLVFFSEAGGTCKCLPGDPDGTCATRGGICACKSSGAPSQYDLNDSSCK